MLNVLERARDRHVALPGPGPSDYLNTIPSSAEPVYLEDRDIERRIRSYVRRNAAMIVHRAQRPGLGVGGHMSTYASTATLYEVGATTSSAATTPTEGETRSTSRATRHRASTRAFLEGRLSERRLDGFRQEASQAASGGGLPSYPHPRLMPDSARPWTPTRVGDWCPPRSNRQARISAGRPSRDLDAVRVTHCPSVASGGGHKQKLVAAKHSVDAVRSCGARDSHAGKARILLARC
jgi:hypothetical protein